jgi:hypothetical protein
MKNAFFIVGCPNSGKDILIKDLLSKFELEELTFDQAKKYIDKNTLAENVLIKGNAYDYNNIFQIKESLENLYYKIALIYVDIEEDTLYKRDVELTEQKRNKLILSKENLQKFEQDFHNLFVFDNNSPIQYNTNQILNCENFVSYIIDPISYIREKSNARLKDYIYKNFSTDKEIKKDKKPKSFYSHSALKPDGYNEYDIRDSGQSNVVHFGEDIGSPEALMTATGMSFSNIDDYPEKSIGYSSIKKKKTDYPNFNSPAKKNVWKRTRSILFRK